MKKILYISSAVDPIRLNDIIGKRVSKKSNSLEPIAKYNNLLIDGLSKNKDIEEIISLIGAPISRRSFSYKYFEGSKRKDGKKTYIMIGFLNFPLIKHLTIFLKSLIYIIYWNLKNLNKNKIIMIDGSYFTEILSVYAGNLFFKTPVVYNILDIYNYMAKIEGHENDSIKIKFLRNIYSIIKTKVSGFITITEDSNKLINPMSKPNLVIEGIVPYKSNHEFDETGYKNIFIYAGGLQERYGIKILIDAFKKVDSQYELWLFGLGDQIEYIEKTSKDYKNIIYKGSISNDELMNIEKQAFCLVNPRPTKEEYTKYSFPSKTMEYMLTGRPTLTTKLQGIPYEYDKYLFYIEDETEEGIAFAINKIINYDRKELQKKAYSAREFVLNNKNNIKQGSRLNDFLNKL